MINRPLLTKPLIILVILLTIINLSVLAFVAWPAIQTAFNPSVTPASTLSHPTVEATLTPSPTENLSTPSQTPASSLDGLHQQGVMILAVMDNNISHLFAFHPQFLTLTRLTNNPWDDLQPAISPDGSRVVFSSRANGFFDLYIMDLRNQQTIRLTDTPTYDGSPSWSPDGQWIAYETYVSADKNLEIMLQNITDLSQPPVRLTNDNSADYSPSWGPDGREIAFVSTRSGNAEIWLARLDQADNRFTNLTGAFPGQKYHPSWSPNGRYLAWASDGTGTPTIFVWDNQNPSFPPRAVGNGDWPTWNPTSEIILAEFRDPDQSFLAAYNINTSDMAFPMIHLPGVLQGLEWKSGPVPDEIAAFPLSPNAIVPPAALWKPIKTLTPAPPEGRTGLVQLQDVIAPYPFLQDDLDESFLALRNETASETGWDFLLNLDNAYLPITRVNSPIKEDNWLYTGRAFAVNSAPLSAGWMVVCREDLNGQTYWRIYLKARFQDGSQGRPMTRIPWDLNARFDGSPSTYEQGGSPLPIPEGYWIDFTDLAVRYGWQRLPSLTTWRTYFPSVRFNQYVQTSGLDYSGAMAELYPPEALQTPTPVPTYTPTPTLTNTPRNYLSLTPTPSTTITPSPSLNPTWTAIAGTKSP